MFFACFAKLSGLIIISAISWTFFPTSGHTNSVVAPLLGHVEGSDRFQKTRNFKPHPLQPVRSKSVKKHGHYIFVVFGQRPSAHLTEEAMEKCCSFIFLGICDFLGIKQRWYLPNAVVYSLLQISHFGSLKGEEGVFIICNEAGRVKFRKFSEGYFSINGKLFFNKEKYFFINGKIKQFSLKKNDFSINGKLFSFKEK